MDNRRMGLHQKFKDLCPNVYHQAPPNTRMTYTAIRYNPTGRFAEFGDNNAYIKKWEYRVQVLTKDANEPLVEKILEMPFSRYVNYFPKDGLHQHTIHLFY